jgi:UDP-N-acetylmuramyl pentapeptide phosphotransferase/UDP-N-acetylglucosamine-1-phosphate transferase
MLKIFLYFVYLLLLTFSQKKLQFCLDKATKKEKHKNLLMFNNNIPLTGGFYFLLITALFLYDKNFYMLMTGLIFVLIGFLSDLKINSSPIIRFISQFILLSIFIWLNKDLIIQTRIEFLDYLIAEKEFIRVLIISFFFLVLINGYNFTDGVNLSCSLNIFIVLIFFNYLASEKNMLLQSNLSIILIYALSIFMIFNFFGKTFLGDSGVYILSFFLGLVGINISLLSSQISPYFIANLLWYPAFENLFTIFRRTFLNKKNYIADNLHMHHLIYLFFKKHKILKKKYLLSSLTGILINIYFLIFYFIGYLNYSDTKNQIFLIVSNMIIYTLIYQKLKKQHD